MEYKIIKEWYDTHFKVRKPMTFKPSMTFIAILLGIGFALLPVQIGHQVIAGKVNCSAFVWREDAQVTYDRAQADLKIELAKKYPDLRKIKSLQRYDLLDRDHDKAACESLPKHGSTSK